jgi:hypothetical protein
VASMPPSNKSSVRSHLQEEGSRLRSGDTMVSFPSGLAKSGRLGPRDSISIFQVSEKKSRKNYDANYKIIWK